MAANQHGGYRAPTHPAPVSGPGSLSQRTDGGPASPEYVSGLPYGEGQDFYDLQSSAPLGSPAAKPRNRSGNSSPVGGAATPLFMPTQRPDEPVTAGAPFGPGDGPDMAPRTRVSLADTLATLLPYDETGDIGSLLALASARGW